MCDWARGWLYKQGGNKIYGTYGAKIFSMRQQDPLVEDVLGAADLGNQDGGRQDQDQDQEEEEGNPSGHFAHAPATLRSREEEKNAKYPTTS